MDFRHIRRMRSHGNLLNQRGARYTPVPVETKNKASAGAPRFRGGHQQRDGELGCWHTGYKGCTNARHSVLADPRHVLCLFCKSTSHEARSPTQPPPPLRPPPHFVTEVRIMVPQTQLDVLELTHTLEHHHGPRTSRTTHTHGWRGPPWLAAHSPQVHRPWKLTALALRHTTDTI